MPAKECVDRGNEACDLNRPARWWHNKVLIDRVGGHHEKERVFQGRLYWCLKHQSLAPNSANPANGVNDANPANGAEQAG